jgi:FkbM family methyltransferase
MNLAPLVYDVGLNNGDDSAYYLAKGYSVVGIDANVEHCNACRQRFAKEINAGRMIVLDVGVGESESLSEFFIYDPEDSVSSFARPTFDVHNWRTIKVPVHRLSSIVKDHGTPYFIKIDVEHFDHLVLMDLLLAGVRPQYISAECHTIDTFCALVCMGYSQFQLVDGESIPRSFSDHSISTLDGERKAWSFSRLSSGPFGEDLTGSWLDKNSVLASLLSHGLGWIDLHAKFE